MWPVVKGECVQAVLEGEGWLIITEDIAWNIHRQPYVLMIAAQKTFTILRITGDIGYVLGSFYVVQTVRRAQLAHLNLYSTNYGGKHIINALRQSVSTLAASISWANQIHDRTLPRVQKRDNRKKNN